MKLIFFALFALVVQTAYGGLTQREKKLLFGLVDAGFCLLHNAKCTVFYTGAAAFCTAQNIVNQSDCDNEYSAADALCNQNKQTCGW